LNLGDHVGDNSDCVAKNRARLVAALNLPAAPCWLAQCHGTRVIDPSVDRDRRADGACTAEPKLVCAVLTADCLPILLCDRAGKRVAALHAGWRGLAGGIIARGVAAMQVPGPELLAWLGPAIGVESYEIGAEAHGAFSALGMDLQDNLHATRPGHWRMDLDGIARSLLNAQGVVAIYGARHCTYKDAERFYSHRRDGVTGRMANMIWIAP
jgi:YfiH family protein